MRIYEKEKKLTKEHPVVAEISVIPIGAGTHLHEYVAHAVQEIEGAGLDHELTAMGTVVEARWDQIMAVLKKIHERLLCEVDRVLIHVVLDSRKDKVPSMRSKVNEVEEFLGTEKTNQKKGEPNMKLSEIMTSKVETIETGDSLRRAADIMRKQDVGLLPVFSKKKLVGVVTDRDIVIRAVCKGLDAERTKVETVMTGEVASGTEDMDVREAAKIMEDKKIRRLLVLDGMRHVLGIVTLGDIATRAHDANTVEEISVAVSHV